MLSVLNLKTIPIIKSVLLAALLSNAVMSIPVPANEIAVAQSSAVASTSSSDVKSSASTVASTSSSVAKSTAPAATASSSPDTSVAKPTTPATGSAPANPATPSDPASPAAPQDPVTITPCKNNATEIFEYFSNEISGGSCTGEKLMCTPFGCLMGGDNSTATCFEKDYVIDSCTLGGGSIVYCVPPATTGLRNGTACAFPGDTSYRYGK